MSSPLDVSALVPTVPALIPELPPAGGRPTDQRHVSAWYLFRLGFAQFGVFVALLTPVFVTMQLKAQEIAPDNPAGVIGAVLPIGALGAVVANPLFGALSDRTRTRWGRRRPWMIGGVLVFFAGLIVLAAATSTAQLMVGWLVCQLASNAVTGALLASFADNVPEDQRGRGSASIALAINLSILAGLYIAVPLAEHLTALFIVPGFLAIGAVVLYCARTRDEVPARRLPPYSGREFVRTFWTNPLKNPDFAWAWWSRFLITLAMFMFTTYRLLYMQDQLGMSTHAATAAIALGTLIYTLVLLGTSALSGWLSDRSHRRKVFVVGSTLLTGVGLVVLAHAHDLATFYLAEALMGAAYGVYSAVDTALVVDVLPDPERAGKDLGVFNIANAAPQSLAPALGLGLLGIGVSGTTNYTVMLCGAGVVCALGALAILPIRKVR